MSNIINLNEFIRGGNYLDVDQLIYMKSSDISIRYISYAQLNRIEIDSDETTWLIFKYQSGYYDQLVYNLCLSIAYPDRIKRDDLTIYIHLQGSPKTRIFDHCIFPVRQIIEIYVKLPNDLNLKHILASFDQQIRVNFNILNISIQNVITDHYLICDKCIYPLDYLSGDVFIESQPHKLLLFKQHSTTNLPNFFNQYQIKGSDLIITTLDSNLDPLTNINIKYQYCQDIYTFTECNDGILICEFPNGDLRVTICETVYVQLSWI